MTTLVSPAEPRRETTKGAKAAMPLIAATRPFATEVRTQSWWYFWMTLVSLFGVLSIAVVAPWWPLRVAASGLGALLMVRGFIIYHDYMHGAILQDSRLASIAMAAYGCLLLVPPRSWCQSHNHHHAHVGKLASSSIGSFPIMTTAMWREAPLSKRLAYRIVRSPAAIATAYLTVFALTVTIVPLLRSPRKYWDSAVALLVHAGAIAALWWLGGPAAPIFGLVLPFAIASAIGAYLFYAQHNFVGMNILPPSEWTLERSALESCSYLRLGRLMRWFTGDIGYHHIHHLNSRIPFYRLREAMHAIPRAQHPTVTSLWPRDVLACLRLKLWDEDAQTMVGYPGRDPADPGARRPPMAAPPTPGNSASPSPGAS